MRNDQGVPGGQVTTVWDNYGPSSLNNNPNADTIESDRVTNGGAADIVAGLGGPINDAIAISGQPDRAVPTSFTANVDITDLNFTTLSSLAITLNIRGSVNEELSAVLTGPNGLQFQTTLFANNENGAGTVTGNDFGLTGNNLGIATDGEVLGTTFDAQAAREINDQGRRPVPTSGNSFPREERCLNNLVGKTAAQHQGPIGR